MLLVIVLDRFGSGACLPRKELFFTMNTNKKRRGTTQLAIDGMLAALCVVLGFASIRIGNIIKISFEDLPVMFAALMFGPVDGVAVAFIGIFLYQLFSFGITVTTPLWVLPFVTAGLVYGLIAKKYNFNNTPRQILIIFITSAFLILGLNTIAIYADSKIYGYYYPTIITGVIGVRAIIALVKGIAVGLIAAPVLKTLSRITKNGPY